MQLIKQIMNDKKLNEEYGSDDVLNYIFDQEKGFKSFCALARKYGFKVNHNGDNIFWTKKV